MIRTNFKGLAKVQRTLSDGTLQTYCYAWRGGPLLRDAGGKPLQPDDPAIPAALSAAHDCRRNPQTNDLSMLIREFRSSSDFRMLSKATSKDYLIYLDMVREKFGSLSLSELEQKETRGKFKTWRDTMAETPRAADYAWTTLARVLSFAKDRGRIAINVCERGGRLYHANRRDRIWTVDDIAKFTAVAPTYMRLAMLMALWTGQRQGDLLRAQWSSYDGKVLKMQQSKTGVRVIIPVGATLRAEIGERGGRHGTILVNTRGDTWTAEGFRTAWRRCCDGAHITGLTFHDLRGTAVTRLALAGCTVAEIAAITGHSMLDVHQILDAHYLGGKLDLAERAIAKLEAAEAIRPGT
jgi:integrase